jgi:hypothetical protein
VANHFAIHSVGNSLMTYLRNSYPEPLRTETPCDFLLLSSGELAENVEPGTALSLFLYRVTVNEHLRNAGRVEGAAAAESPLSLDLHYLLSVWAESALTEQLLLAWAMHQLHRYPVLDTSRLSPEADWQHGDFVQMIPAELSNEDVMRIWDALEPSYRLSVSYIARVVRIDSEAEPGVSPVVATRFSFTDRAGEPQ